MVNRKNIVPNIEANKLDVKYIITSLGRIRLFTTGDGEQSIVFLHGAGSDHALLSWREVLESLPQHYTAYAIDLLGHGNSDKLAQVAGESYYEAHLNVIEEVVHQLKLNNFILVGLSMGGAIATAYTLRHEKQVKALCLVNSWGFTEKMPYHALTYWLLHHTSMTLLQFKWMSKSRALAKWAIHYALLGNKALITNKLIDEVMQSCNKSDAGFAMQLFQKNSIHRNRCYPYLTYKLKQLQLPIAFISGDKDRLVPVKIIRVAAEQCNSSSLHILEQCKHWAVKEQPHQLIAILDQYK